MLIIVFLGSSALLICMAISGTSGHCFSLFAEFTLCIVTVSNITATSWSFSLDFNIPFLFLGTQMQTNKRVFIVLKCSVLMVTRGSGDDPASVVTQTGEGRRSYWLVIQDKTTEDNQAEHGKKASRQKLAKLARTSHLRKQSGNT